LQLVTGGVYGRRHLFWRRDGSRGVMSLTLAHVN
jgi:hypothetical protein